MCGIHSVPECANIYMYSQNKVGEHLPLKTMGDILESNDVDMIVMNIYRVCHYLCFLTTIFVYSVITLKRWLAYDVTFACVRFSSSCVWFHQTPNTNNCAINRCCMITKSNGLPWFIVHSGDLEKRWCVHQLWSLETSGIRKKPRYIN